jgi:Putative prokaryotic signal transducing protein
MTEVFRNRDSALIGHLQSLLESEGIKTYLRNEYASSTTIAIPEVTPALCILEDVDVERGVELIRAYIESSSAGAEVEQTCPRCSETSPGTFAVCWKCGAALDPTP